MEISPWQNIYCHQSPIFFFLLFSFQVWLNKTSYMEAQCDSHKGFSIFFFKQTRHAYRMVIFRHQILTLFVWIIERCKEESMQTPPSVGLKDILWWCEWVQTSLCAWACPALFAQSHTLQEVFLKSLTMLHSSDNPHAGAWDERWFQQHQLLYLTSIHFQKAVDFSLSRWIWNSCDLLFLFIFKFYFPFSTRFVIERDRS